MIRSVILFLLISALAVPAACTGNDTLSVPAKETRKKGWTWAALPIAAWDADMGLQLGVLGQVFDYGDGASYPEYHHTFYAEYSWFNRGSAVYQLFYDSKYLLPGKIRVTAALDYLPERMLDFYGFNGYESNFTSAVTQESSPGYISRMFYRQERKMYRVLADFQGPLAGNRLRWLAGINVIGMHMATVDIGRLNKGKKEGEKLPDTALLYDKYVQYGLIRPDEKNGGTTVFLKAGLVYDTRDAEAAPDRGIWSEALLLAAPTFLGNHPYAFVKIALTHRQFIPLVSKKLVAACQLSYQGTVGGTTPWYILPYLYSSYALTTKPDGLGGNRTLRGVMRNRITGDGVAFGNLELRWKVYQAVILKQNLWVGLTGFADGGMVVQKHPIPENSVPADQHNLLFGDSHDRLHLSAGLGLRVAVNNNFIIAVDYGRAFNPQDGKSGLYIGIGNIF